MRVPGPVRSPGLCTCTRTPCPPPAPRAARQVPLSPSMSHRWLEDAITDWQTAQGQRMHLGGLAGHYTPQQVEEVKMVLRLMPVFFTTMLYWWVGSGVGSGDGSGASDRSSVGLGALGRIGGPVSSTAMHCCDGRWAGGQVDCAAVDGGAPGSASACSGRPRVRLLPVCLASPPAAHGARQPPQQHQQHSAGSSRSACVGWLECVLISADIPRL